MCLQPPVVLHTVLTASRPAARINMKGQIGKREEVVQETSLGNEEDGDIER